MLISSQWPQNFRGSLSQWLCTFLLEGEATLERLRLDSRTPAWVVVGLIGTHRDNYNFSTGRSRGSSLHPCPTGLRAGGGVPNFCGSGSHLLLHPRGGRGGQPFLFCAGRKSTKPICAVEPVYCVENTVGSSSIKVLDGCHCDLFQVDRVEN